MLSNVQIRPISAGSITTLAAPPFNAGLQPLAVPYYKTNIETFLWFPTTESESTQSLGVYAPRLAPGGRPAKGRFPLVVISHGAGGSSLNHHIFAGALARHGFVVVTFTHPGDNHRDRSLAADHRYFYERPRQITHVLDAVQSDYAWRERIDWHRVGAIGHSVGGYSVAALIGGTPDRARAKNHCMLHPDDPACSFGKPEVGVASAGGPAFSLPVWASNGKAVRDARVQAAVLLAPLGVAITPGSLQNSTARVRLIGAQFDDVLKHAYHFDYLRAELPDAKATLAKGAGHYSFIAPPLPAAQPRFGAAAVDPIDFNREAFQIELAIELIAFFEDALKID